SVSMIAAFVGVLAYQSGYLPPRKSGGQRVAMQTSNGPKAIEDWKKCLRVPGTNAGSNKPLTAEVAGWTYHLAAEQGRIAAYRFNESGTVVATVGEEGKLDYPAMFWKIDENNRIVVSDDRDFSIPAEL